MSCPNIIKLNDFNGDWNLYLEAVYKSFLDNVVNYDLRFRGKVVSYRRTPMIHGKSHGFWHIIQEGKKEEERTPDLRRCERIPWIKYIIENEKNSDDIQVWENSNNRQKNTLLWFKEEYLVILSKRKNVQLLKTAYCTEKEHRIRTLRKERDQYLNRYIPKEKIL